MRESSVKLKGRKREWFGVYIYTHAYGERAQMQLPWLDGIEKKAIFVVTINSF